MCGEIFACELTQIMEKFFEAPPQTEQIKVTENESPKVKRVDTEELELDQITTTMTLTDRDEED